MYGIRDLVSVLTTLWTCSLTLPTGKFWAPGGFELVVLAFSAPNCKWPGISLYYVLTRNQAPDGELFVIPFAKSASTGQHIPVCTHVVEFDYF